MEVNYAKSFVRQMTDKIDPELVGYYKEEKEKNKLFDRPLEKIVEQILKEELNETDKAVLSKVAYAKKKVLARKKSRYYKSCEEMVKTEAWKKGGDNYFFRDHLTVYNMTGALMLNDVLYMDFQTMERDMLENIKKWSKNKETRMIDFPGQGKKTPKSREKDFLLDLTINIFKIAEQDYGYDLSSAVYVGVDEISSNALFTWKKQSVKETDLENGKLEVYRSEDGKKRTVMTFQPEAFKDKKSVTLFDSTDLQILSYLLLQWERNYSTTMPLPVRIIDIYHAINGNTKKKPSAKHYEEIWNRCYKLWSLGFESYSEDNIVGGRRIIADLQFDKENNIIYYTMSQFLTDEIRDGKIRKMPAEQLNRLEDNVARILYYPFMKNRVAAYEAAKRNRMGGDCYPMQIRYESFLRWINFGKSTKKENNDAIMEALEEFKEKSIFVKNYRYVTTKGAYYIEFYPLTEMEIQDLDFYFNRDPEEVIEQLNILAPIMD